MVIVEAFRAPQSFDLGTVPVFNTNTFVFDAHALHRKFDLEWFAAFKKVDDDDVVCVLLDDIDVRSGPEQGA